MHVQGLIGWGIQLGGCMGGGCGRGSGWNLGPGNGPPGVSRQIDLQGLMAGGLATMHVLRFMGAAVVVVVLAVGRRL